MIENAVAELTRRGWTSFAGTLEDLTGYAENAGWDAVPLRRGEAPVSDLHPVDVASARPNSMSSRTGIGAQPLHTDGAHLQSPPDVVALESTRTHRAATRLWSSNCSNVPWEDLRHGVFGVSNGRARSHRLAAVDECIRYDPCCMFPLDERARRVVRFFAATFDASHRHEWLSDSPEVLMIDNRRTLHAREAVDPTAPPRHLKRIAFRHQAPK